MRYGLPSMATADLAPEPYLSACLAVLYRATVEARFIGYAGHQAGLGTDTGERLADLMDAVHNIPGLLQSWSTCDEDLLRGMLRDYDSKWRDATGVLLLETYEHALTGAV